jgi:hypothetical protein
MADHMRLYLAHPILDRDWIRREELRLEQELDLDLVNPFYDATRERSDIKKIDAGELKPFSRELDSKDIVMGDLNEINHANGLLGFVTEKYSIGTFMEVFYNSYVLRRPTYLIVMNEQFFAHPWLRFLATKVFRSVADFEKWYKNDRI